MKTPSIQQETGWTRFRDWALARIKAGAAAVGATSLAYLTTVLLDPSTTEHVGGILPENYKWLAPVLVGLGTAIVVERSPRNIEPTSGE